MTSLILETLRGLREHTLAQHQEYMELGKSRQQKLEEVAEGVDAYNAQRSLLIKHELETRNMGWCTYCEKEAATIELALLFIEGTSQYSCGYEGGDWGHRNFKCLHRACSTCRQHAAHRHGHIGGYGSNFEEREKFYAFEVEKREDGYYACRFGSWTKVTEGVAERLSWDPPEKLVDRFCDEWNFPKRVKLDHTGTLHDPN